MFYYTAFQLPKLNFLYVVKQQQGFAKMYFSLTISMYQGTKMAIKNALLLGFLQSAKTGNLRALLTRSENALLGNIFTSLCCNCDTKHACKRSF